MNPIDKATPEGHVRGEDAANATKCQGNSWANLSRRGHSATESNCVLRDLCVRTNSYDSIMFRSEEMEKRPLTTVQPSATYNNFQPD